MAFAKLNSMKFVGLDGLSHFWSKAKTWIINRIAAEVTAKIAEIVANAPEDLDTLKEIADWISTHEDSAAAMNTAISINASDIATLKTSVAGKSDTGHTHTKSEITDFPDSLPANGGTATKATQDGSGNVITSTYVKKSGDTLTSSTSDTPLYVNTTASGNIKSWIGFQIGSVSKNFIGADQNGLYSYTNSKNNKILDTSAQTLTDEEKTQVRSNIGAGTSSLTIGTTETTAAAGNHTHSGYLTAHQDISGKLNVDGSNATNTGTSAIVHSLDTATDDVTDDTEIITSNASGYSSSDTKYYKRAGNKLWNYIKGKISSVLGLTAMSYSGKANTAGTADNAKGLKTFASWGNPYAYDATNGIRYFVFKITMPSYFNSILVQVDNDINYAQSKKYILGLWHTSGYGYNVSVTDLGGTNRNFLRVWLGNDGNVYLQAAAVWISRILFSNLDEAAANITVEKIGASRLGSNTDLDGNVLFTPLADPIIDCGALRSADLRTASKQKHYLKSDEFIGTATNATNATNDSNGNNIANTYMPKSGGTFKGNTYFNSSIHCNEFYPKDDITSGFWFYKDTDSNAYLPMISSYNCGSVFNNKMCLKYYTLNCSNKNEALKKLNELKKLFASMYPYDTDGCARCTSIHAIINVAFTNGQPDIIGDIINYGYCNSDNIVRVNKDGSVYVGEDFYSNYHVLYISYDDGFKEKDAYYLANEILKNNMSNINYFSFIGNYVLAEHL